MYGWETRMLLKHYLDQGVSQSELARRFGINRTTMSIPTETFSLLPTENFSLWPWGPSAQARGLVRGAGLSCGSLVRCRQTRRRSLRRTSDPQLQRGQHPSTEPGATNSRQNCWIFVCH